VSFLRSLAAGLAHRWGGFPRSEKVRVVLLAVSVPLTGLVAWQTAMPTDDLKASVRSLTDKRAYAQEPSRRGMLVSFDQEADGQPSAAPSGQSAKVTFESRPIADTKGAGSAVGQHDLRPETSNQRGGSSDDAEPRFRKDGARGDGFRDGGASAQ